MKCLACDVILSEGEDARKFADSGNRVELCNRCVVWVNLPMVGGDDAVAEDDSEMESLDELDGDDEQHQDD